MILLKWTVRDVTFAVLVGNLLILTLQVPLILDSNEHMFLLTLLHVTHPIPTFAWFTRG